MEKIKVTVRVADRDYTLYTRDSREKVERIGRTVERKMTEMSVLMRIPMADTAVLTAMDFCDDMLKARDEVTALRIRLEQAEKALAEERALREAQA